MNNKTRTYFIISIIMALFFIVAFSLFMSVVEVEVFTDVEVVKLLFIIPALAVSILGFVIFVTNFYTSTNKVKPLVN